MLGVKVFHLLLSKGPALGEINGTECPFRISFLCVLPLVPWGSEMVADLVNRIDRHEGQKSHRPQRHSVLWNAPAYAHDCGTHRWAFLPVSESQVAHGLGIVLGTVAGHAVGAQ